MTSLYAGKRGRVYRIPERILSVKLGKKIRHHYSGFIAVSSEFEFHQNPFRNSQEMSQIDAEFLPSQ